MSASELPPVLELRVHGVNNTSPASMLSRPDCQLRQVDGDKLGSFWRIWPDLLGERGPGPGSERDQDGHVPGQVLREAYSWGWMSRSASSADRGVLANVGSRIGWTLLLPFGLTNVAYWARELPTGRPGSAGWWGPGAASVRAFGLGLTVLFVSAVCEVASDLFATQCYDARTGRLTCLSGWLRWLPLDGEGISTRLGWASVVPVTVLVVLWLLGHASRLRYEDVTVDPTPSGAPPPGPPPGEATSPRAAPPPAAPRPAPLLARPELWRGGLMVRGMTPVHLSAGFAVAVLASAWPAVFGSGPDCRPPWADPARCVAQVGRTTTWPVFLPMVGLALGVITVALALAVRKEDPAAPSRGLAAARWGLLAGSVALFLVNLGCLLGSDPVIDANLPLPGANTLPTIVIALLTGIAAAGFGWRASPIAAAVAGGLVGAGLLAMYLYPLLGGLVAAGLLLVVAAVRASARRHPDVAWRGSGPGVLLSLALLVAITLSTLLVVGAGNVLNGLTLGLDDARDLVCDGVTARDPICVPAIYVWLGIGTVLVTGLALLAAGALGLVLLDRFRREPLPGSADDPAPPAPPVRSARLRAAVLHRAEPAVGGLGALSLVMVVLTVAGPAVDPGVLGDVGRWLAKWGIVALGFGAAAFAIVYAGFGARRSGRPLGLVWDLICFLPRAAHPFAPPCYAERAVPELTQRIRYWLDDRPERRVVLSAHSLGAVLAVAVLYVLGPDHRRRTSLITYGVQLRPYFGRIFPQLLGSAVLGGASCGRPRLQAADPWGAEAGGPELADPAPDTVRGILGDRWTNLWRRTDYLGFPVLGYDANDVDRRADEVLDSALGAQPAQTHGGYPRTVTYQRALLRLAGRSDDDEPPTRPPSAPAAPPGRPFTH